jgi:Sulfotransferase domain
MALLGFFGKTVAAAFAFGFVLGMIRHSNTKVSTTNYYQSCDLLPLTNGHNIWDDVTNSTVKVHTSETHICGPRVLIVGAMKCGTNTIGHILHKHPRVKVNECEASRFEDCNMTAFQGSRHGDVWEGNDYTIGRAMHPDDWMATWTERLPWTDGVSSISIDKSPSYFNTAKWTDLTRFMHELLPNSKVIVTVCNPAERAFSVFHHYMDKDTTASETWKKRFIEHGFPNVKTFDDFADFLFLECGNSPNKYFCSTMKKEILQYGEYAKRLQPWYESYGKDNVLVLNMNEDNVQKAQKILSLVGSSTLPPEEYPWEELNDESERVAFKNSHYEGRSSAFTQYPESMAKLTQHFILHNQELAEILGEDFPLEWNDEFEIN